MADAEGVDVQPGHSGAAPQVGEDVLVVGAGPVGLVAACELVRQGASVRIVESLSQPNQLSRAVAIQPRSQEALAALGALAGLTAIAQPQIAVELFAGRASKARVRLHADVVASRYQRVLNLPQSDTEAVLARRALDLGVTVERGVRLATLAQTPDGVNVTLVSGTGTETARVGWVIGADGAHSTVRTAVGTSLDGVFRGQCFVLADATAETDRSPDTTRMFAHADGLAAVFPMAGGRNRFMFAVDKPADGATPSLELVQELIDQRAAGQWTLTAAHWLAYFEVHHGQVPDYRFGRVLLAGDAAHIHSPAGGQGMNTGIQDAVNLAWKLALVSTGRADSGLLDSYHTERHPIAAGVIRATTMMTNVMASSGAVKELRNVALFLIGHITAIEDAIISSLTEVTINYRESSIVGPGGAHHRAALRPGDHAPEIAGLTDAEGSEAFITDLLKAPGHLVLVRSNDPTEAVAMRDTLGDLGTVMSVVPRSDGADDGSIIDAAGGIAAAYGVGDDGLVIIRPDGYVGMIAQPASVEVLTDYLTHYLSITSR